MHLGGFVQLGPWNAHGQFSLSPGGILAVGTLVFLFLFAKFLAEEGILGVAVTALWGNVFRR
jgi:hypothetical protein